MARGIAAPTKANQTVTVSVRKISNGYVIDESKSTPRGYQSKETFSPNKPVMPSPAKPTTVRKK